MIYTGLNKTGEVQVIHTHGGGTVEAVYGGINYQNPIFYSRKTLTGTSPLTFKGLGQSLKDYHIFGETIQNGTPSPDYPVEVQGCGEETSNLFYPYTVVKGRLDGGAIGYDSSTTELTINSNKVTYSINAGYRGVSTDFIKITSQNNKVTFFGSFSGPGGQYKKVVFYDEQKLWMHRDIDIAPSASEWTLSIPTGAKYLRISIMGERAGSDYNFYGFMVTPGQSVTPYEPYGYKIPVTIGNATTPIYIGADPMYRSGDNADEIDFGNQRIIRRVDPTTMQPYATPITSAITIPQLTAVFGDNTLTVDTTVKPSAVSITGNIKPTGYGQLLDVNDVDIQDKNSTPLFI